MKVFDRLRIRAALDPRAVEVFDPQHDPPAVLPARAQLIKKVLALPRCSAPVGDGANRVVRGGELVGGSFCIRIAGSSIVAAWTPPRVCRSVSGAPAWTPGTAGIPIRLAVLLSGGGTTLQNLGECINRGELNARITLVVSSNPEAYGLTRAKNLGLPATTVPRKAYKTAAEFSDFVFAQIRAASADLVCLAGFLSLLKIPDDFARRVINIHPALLPSFGGKGMHGHHVHEAVLAAGCKVSGCTVHFADQTYDTGPIIVQRCCPVLDDDTPEMLAKRVFEEECLAYPEAIRMIAQGRVKVGGQAIQIRPD